MKYGVLHSIGGNDIGIIVANIGVDASGEEAYGDVPFDHEMAPVCVPPYSANSHPRFAMPLLEVEALHLIRHASIFLFLFLFLCPEKFFFFFLFKQIKKEEEEL